jgi:hypothetical protein
MRTIEDIIADAQKATAASMREAFEAGRAHTAAELKTRMAAFFDGLVSGTHHEAPVDHQQNGQSHDQQGDHHDHHG